MKFVKKFFPALFCISLLFIFQQSCQKIDTTDIGAGLIPAIDNVHTFDTSLQVIATSTLFPDSTRVLATENHALGIMDDPEFGRTTANMYFDVLPSTAGTYPFISKDSIVSIDSVVLSLDYKGLYGDSNAVENFRVFEIDKDAQFNDSAYPIRSPDFPVVATQLGEKTVDFTTLNDPQVIKKGKDTALVTEQNILRIKLDRSLGIRLSQYDTTNAYKSDSAFRSKFKGFAIRADSVKPTRKKALAYFNLADNAKSRLTVYYRVKNNNATDTTFTEFIYKNLVSRGANIIKRNIAATNYAANLAPAATTKEKLYLQTSPGSYCTITIPGLGGLSNRLIYKAELIVEKLPSDEDAFFSPPILFLDLIQDSASNKFITVKNDFTTDYSGNYNFSEFGGGIKKTNQYAFNLSRHIQGIVTRKETVYKFRLYAPFRTWPTFIPEISNNGVYLVVNSNVAGGRVVVGGGNHPTSKMRLRIIYSKI